jgi:UDP:flavonoid glycosyltransferase YjiC (YdhE family)
MHALLFALGSAGDVLPFVGLGRALRARGHAVTVAANPHFAGLVTRAGLGFVALGDEDEYEALCQSPKFMDRARGFRFVMDWVSTLIRPIYELAAAHRSSLVVAHPLALGARVAQERLGVRTATLVLSPAILRGGDGWVQRSVRWAADRLIVDRVVAPPLNAFREAKGLPPVTRALSHGWNDTLSLAMYPPWFAPREAYGRRRLVHAGFPLFDDADGDDGAPLPAIFDERPLVFTPGTGNRCARAFFAAAVDASARLGRRAVLLTAHREQLPPSLPAHVEAFAYLPLSRILPRASALVHHGGIGSAAAALAAGVPQLVVPFAHDQPDNAARLCRLGVARALSPLRVGGAVMAARLERLTSSPAVARRCRALAVRISPGVERACGLLEVYANAARPHDAPARASAGGASA